MKRSLFQWHKLPLTISLAALAVFVAGAKVERYDQIFLRNGGTTTITLDGPTGAITASSISVGAVSNTEFQYLNGLTGNIQDQIDSIEGGGATITGTTSDSFTVNSDSSGTGASVIFNGAGNDGTISYSSTTDEFTFNQIVNATIFAGSGVLLNALNASNLGSGTVPDARFPANIPRLDTPNAFVIPNGTGAGESPGGFSATGGNGGAADYGIPEVGGNGSPFDFIAGNGGDGDAGQPGGSGGNITLTPGVAGYDGGAGTGTDGRVIVNGIFQVDGALDFDVESISDSALSSNAQSAVANQHTQNTDTGTSFSTFFLNNDVEADSNDASLYFGLDGITGVGLHWDSGADEFGLTHALNAPAFAGIGTLLTALNATNLGSGIVPLARIDGITNTQIAAGAAIAYSKLNLATSIVNADIGAAAAIADTKLATIATAGKVSDSALSANVSLLGSAISSAEITNDQIVNADINSAAAIVDTKLATIATAGKVSDSALSANVSLLGSAISSAEITDDQIVNADINSAAAIVDTKLATIATAGKVSDSALSANVSLLGSAISSAEITDDQIVNADINSAAAIVDTKLAQIATPSKVSGAALVTASVADAALTNNANFAKINDVALKVFLQGNTYGANSYTMFRDNDNSGAGYYGVVLGGNGSSSIPAGNYHQFYGASGEMIWRANGTTVINTASGHAINLRIYGTTKLAVHTNGAATSGRHAMNTATVPSAGAYTQGVSYSEAIANKTAAYTCVDTDSVITADATSAAFTVTLPTAVGRTGQKFTVKRTNSAANNVTVGTTSSQTIDGATTYALSAQYASITVISDGANWHIIAKLT